MYMYPQRELIHYDNEVCRVVILKISQHCVNTVYARSDAVVTVYFMASLCTATV